jgi:hypothetical protein
MDMALQLRMANAGVRQAIIRAPVGALRFHEDAKSGRMYFGFVREGRAVRRRYATTRKQRIYGELFTVAFIAVRPVWRLTLTPQYRALRSRLIRR